MVVKPGDIVLKIGDFECKPYLHEAKIGEPIQSRYWHKIVAAHIDSTDYDCELNTGDHVIIKAMHGSDLHKGFSQLGPSIYSPFNLEVSK